MALILTLTAGQISALADEIKLLYPHYKVIKKEDAKAKQAIPKDVKAEDVKAKEAKPEPKEAPKESPPNPDIISRPDQNDARPEVPVNTETPQAKRPVKPAPSGKPELSGTKPDKNPAQKDRAASSASPRKEPVPRDQSVKKGSPADRDQAVPSDPARRDILVAQPIERPLTEDEIKAKIKEGQFQIEENNRKKAREINYGPQTVNKKEEKAIAPPTAVPTAAPDSGAAVQAQPEMDGPWTEEERKRWRERHDRFSDEEREAWRERHRDGHSWSDHNDDWREGHQYFVPQPDWRQEMQRRQYYPRRYSYDDDRRSYYYRYPSYYYGYGRPAYYYSDYNNDTDNDHVYTSGEQTVLPSAASSVSAGGRTYYYSNGAYYERSAASYAAVPPPVGAVVNELPPEYAQITFGGITYYTYNGVFYKKSWSGYEVTAPPEGLEGVMIATGPRTVNGEESVLVSIPDPQRPGSYVEVKLARFGERGFRGPQGESYSQFPDIEELLSQYEEYHYRLY